ncbi:tripeptidyl-peptidase [Hypomontagnella submonticulosa]|nr:tripeptidyl-peptidase [Hypomontagnella submonticulosa]
MSPYLRCLAMLAIFSMVIVLCACHVIDRTTTYRMKESHPVPTRWRRKGVAPAHHTITLRIALKQGNFEELERRIIQVSDPSHELYGKHLSAAAVRDLVRPKKETIELVTEWLDNHGVRDLGFSPAADWISMSLSVKAIERLLNTTYHVYSCGDDTETLIRAPEWSLPAHLHDHIDAIQPTNSFLRFEAQSRRAEPPEPQWFLEGRLPTYEEMVEEDLLDRGHIDVPEQENIPANPTIALACNRLAVSPLCIRTMYGTLGYTARAPGKNGIGLVNYNGQFNNRSDLETFLETYRKDAAAANAAYEFKSVFVDNERDQQTSLEEGLLGGMADLEGALDIQAIIGAGYPTPVTAYNVGGKPPFQGDASTTLNNNEPYLDWLHYILAQEEIPPVISTSYADNEQTVPEAYARRVCNEFAQLGARGVSVIFASGDHGVGRDGYCKSNDGSDRPQFMPVFPASCPYVTAVGATRLVGPEIVAFDARGGFVSGGGFSNYFSRPKYQEKHVERYLQGLDTALAPYYNAQGRGYPDVSAIGYHYPVMSNGQAHLQDGTSASAPAFAALIAFVNDALLAEGKPTLGFLNPLLYSRGAEAFTDVTIGSNFGCNTTGFPARKGWDAASGLGTPWFPKLKEIALGYRYRSQKPWYFGR